MFTKGRIFGLATVTAGILALSAPMASAACVTNSNGTGGGTQTGLVNVGNVQVNPVVCGDNVQVPVNAVPVTATVPVLNGGPVTTTPDQTSGTASC
ncbi:MAG: hypothetical protein FWE35_11105 [Streptosporangiales bacterium]|jgi:hypothetical protein|nr:hypothetical protein [Streptosporangiales bacterium]